MPTQAWHGPEGALAVGKLDRDRLYGLLLFISLPCAIVFFFGDRSLATFLVMVCSVPFVWRLASLRGTPGLLQEASLQWGIRFVIASVALVGLSYLPSIQTIYVLLALAYAGGMAFYITTGRLVAWQPVKQNSTVMADVSMAQLKVMRDKLCRVQNVLPSLKVFDKADGALLAAWRQGDVGTIAELIAAGDVVTQESWRRATGVLNLGIAHVDSGRGRLRSLVSQAADALAPFKIDYSSIDTSGSPSAYGYTSFAIPKALNFKSIDLQLFILADSKSRIAARLIGDSKPLQVAWKIWAFVAAPPFAARMYKSKWLRQLKDVEGELSTKAATVRGDCTLVSSLLETRIIPHIDGLIGVIERLEAGLAQLRKGQPDRYSMLQIAFALMEGKKLLETKAGN